LVTIGQNNSNEMKKGMIGDNNYIKEKGHPLGGLSLYLNIAFYWIEKTLYQQIFRNKYLKSKS
jgi:hypothetical protein